MCRTWTTRAHKQCHRQWEETRKMGFIILCEKRPTVHVNLTARRVSFRSRMAFCASGVNQWSHAATENHESAEYQCMVGSGHAYASAKWESMRFIWLLNMFKLAFRFCSRSPQFITFAQMISLGGKAFISRISFGAFVGASLVQTGVAKSTRTVSALGWQLNAYNSDLSIGDMVAFESKALQTESPTAEEKRNGKSNYCRLAYKYIPIPTPNLEPFRFRSSIESILFAFARKGWCECALKAREIVSFFNALLAIRFNYCDMTTSLDMKAAWMGVGEESDTIGNKK